MRIWDGVDQPWVLSHVSEVRCLACGQLELELVSPKRWRPTYKIVIKCLNDSCAAKNLEVNVVLKPPVAKRSYTRKTTPVSSRTRKTVE